MTSNRPYLIRAIYDWIVDHELTPYLVADASYEDIHIPTEYVEDNKIILNVSPEACRGLHLDNDKIIFTAKFSGEAMQVMIPPAAVIALYSKENGRGMLFNDESDTSPTPPSDNLESSEDTDTTVVKTKPGKVKLTLIKG